MKLDEKTINKEKEALIIRKYQQYLKLEKALSANTLDAYLTDLDKLLRFLALKDCKIRKRPDRRTCPADSKEVYFKLQFIRPLTFARRYATFRRRLA